MPSSLAPAPPPQSFLLPDRVTALGSGLWPIMVLVSEIVQVRAGGSGPWGGWLLAAAAACRSCRSLRYCC